MKKDGSICFSWGDITTRFYFNMPMRVPLSSRYTKTHGGKATQTFKKIKNIKLNKAEPCTWTPFVNKNMCSLLCKSHSGQFWGWVLHLLDVFATGNFFPGNDGRTLESDMSTEHGNGCVTATAQRLPMAEPRLHQLRQCLLCSIVFASQRHHLLPALSSFLPPTTWQYAFHV